MPRFWAFAMAAMRIRIFSLIDAPESKLRKVELKMVISFLLKVSRKEQGIQVF
jgi:hypothetical protein